MTVKKKKPAAKKTPAAGRYKVTGAHSIDGTAPGGTVTIPDTDLARARRLERTGAI
ncbi:MAG: hypothetical protein GY925_22740, partial [Actinomycetia bacterium]|nr:hypothetical protein [Actinomycetes bacterium]